MKLRNRKMTVYLSGPMTGIPEFNRPAFVEAADELRQKGYEVLVPGDGEVYDDIELISMATTRHKREAYLSRDIDLIQEAADFVVLLPGWDRSEGAKLEVAVAQAIGIPVFSYLTGTPFRGTVKLEVIE